MTQMMLRNSESGFQYTPLTFVYIPLTDVLPCQAYRVTWENLRVKYPIRKYSEGHVTSDHGWTGSECDRWTL